MFEVKLLNFVVMKMCRRGEERRGIHHIRGEDVRFYACREGGGGEGKKLVTIAQPRAAVISGRRRDRLPAALAVSKVFVWEPVL